jgi:excinuclease ABC subunit B
MTKFNLQSKYQPAGDQPEAIEKLVANFQNAKNQTLLGVTGSGKTFTIANVINKIQKPTLVIAHNKTLAAQLADEFREFFPNNAVCYFVSYYDYYQPEAYIQNSDTYIEKDSTINDDIDRLRHLATKTLFTRKDVIIIASVSCIYGLGSPAFYSQKKIEIEKGETLSSTRLIANLIELFYQRNDFEIGRGRFRIRGDILELYPIYSSNSYRIEFFGNRIEKISEVDPISGRSVEEFDSLQIFPAKHFITSSKNLNIALSEIRSDLENQLKKLEDAGKLVEAYRLRQRTEYDLEMIEELGYVSGIENYSRYFDRRQVGQPPFCLLDYFPKDFLTIIDESHITLPQIRGMYAGDRSRKESLVNFGFRLPSAFDNRPLKFDEFSGRIGKTIFMSATPAEYEIYHSTIDNYPKNYNGVVEQIIRPTGLIDPRITVKPTKNQVDDLAAMIKARVEKSERTLVTTLTKKMAEALSEYLAGLGFKVQYLHSDIETIERTEILADLRAGKYDVLIGINLLREGLDLPEVSLVAILDADKEGFLRSDVSLIQTIGRAARHINGEIIMYADRITGSMKRAIEETNRRRKIQLKYNQEHRITPKSVIRSINKIERRIDKEEQIVNQVLDKTESLEQKLDDLRVLMNEAAEKLNFEQAAKIRDRIIEIEKNVGGRA